MWVKEKTSVCTVMPGGSAAPKGAGECPAFSLLEGAILRNKAPGEKVSVVGELMATPSEKAAPGENAGSLSPTKKLRQSWTVVPDLQQQNMANGLGRAQPSIKTNWCPVEGFPSHFCQPPFFQAKCGGQTAGIFLPRAPGVVSRVSSEKLRSQMGCLDWGGGSAALAFPLHLVIPFQEPKKGAGLGPLCLLAHSLTEIGPLPYLLSFQLALCSPFLKALRAEGWLEARARPQLCRPTQAPAALPFPPPCSPHSMRTGSGGLSRPTSGREHTCCCPRDRGL